MAKRTAIYVDGFNLYHSLLKGNDSVKWLDLKALSGALLNQSNEIALIRYFTARVSDTPNDQNLALRQDVYLRALKAHIPELTVQLGQFKTEKKMKPVVSPPPNFIEIWHREEKGSDVNLAVHLVNDAWHDRYDVALVISNDSDLAEALHLVQSRGKPVGVATRYDRPTSQLRQNSDFQRRITNTHLTKSQMPEKITDSAGFVISRPAEWR
jgi:uncharacterized LabA/DUF88 family protein